MRIISEETRRKISESKKGKSPTASHREKIRQSLLGNIPWNKGLKGYSSNEKNTNWKGDNVGYRSLHIWVQRRLGKASFCSCNKKHNSKRFHWANISKKYLRDLNDWVSLCPSCHNYYDRGRIAI